MSQGDQTIQAGTSARATFTRRKSMQHFNAKNSKVSDLLAANIDSVSEERKNPYEAARVELKKFISNSSFGWAYDYFISFVSVTSCFEYIYSTYVTNYDDQTKWLDSLEIYFALVFVFDWTLNFFLADHTMNYLLR
jgi:hypothetical protein